MSPPAEPISLSLFSGPATSPPHTVEILLPNRRLCISSSISSVEWTNCSIWCKEKVRQPLWSITEPVMRCFCILVSSLKCVTLVVVNSSGSDRNVLFSFSESHGHTFFFVWNLELIVLFLLISLDYPPVRGCWQGELQFNISL